MPRPLSPDYGVQHDRRRLHPRRRPHADPPVRPDDLAATVVRGLVERTPFDPAIVDDVSLGDANGAGEDNRDVARMAVLLAGLPVTVPGTTVNRLCASGMEAVAQAS